MNVVIVPGYGDRSDYLKTASKTWSQRFGLEPDIFVFGWNGEAESFDEKWTQFSEYIEQLEDIAIIGISAGASVALRALQTYPNRVKKVVTICGPAHPEVMDLVKLRRDYPVLERSLDQLSLDGLPADRVLTLRPIYDDAVTTKAMIIDGAKNVQMNIAFHSVGIVWAMYVHARRIATFINS